MHQILRPTQRRPIGVALPLLAQLLTLLLALATPAPLHAQAIRGSLLGTISDSSGAGVPGATVTATETQTNISLTTTTNESGFYNFPTLKDGIYRVEAELQGFRKTVRDNIQVDVNTTVRVDLGLQPGEMTETLTVTAETPALQTDRSDTGRLIQGEQIAAMPLGYNRNFQGMWTTVPGTVRPFKPHSEFFNSQDSLSTQVNGQSRLANNVQIEGIDNNHKTGLLTVLIPSAEALETVSVTTSNYDAEFGRAGGAVTSVTLKSGTNQFKGSGFYFGNTDATQAQPYFASSKAKSAYHQGGFTLGGPIVRNKFFFFGDYQRTNDDLGRVYRFAVPTAAMRNGDFSGAATTVYDPLTGDANGNGRTAFPNNQIPADRISPISRAILEHIPLPNLNVALPGNNYEVTATRLKRVDAFDTKFNWQASQRDQLSYRYSFQRPKLEEPAPWGVYGGPFGDGFLGTGTNTTYSTAVNWTRTWSNTLVMDARGGVSNYHNTATTTGNGLNTADELGIRGVNLDEFSSGMPRIEVQNGWGSPFAGFSPSLPWDRYERTIDIAVTLTKLWGNHTVKVGTDVRHNRDVLLQVQDQGGSRGRWRFGASETGTPTDAASQQGLANSLAAFLLDRPGEVGRDLAVLQRPGTRHSAFFTFIHDKWQVTPKMTVDLGLRHERYIPLVGVEDRGGLSNYDPATNTLRVAGYGDVPDNLGVKGTWRNFDPRTGISYRLNDHTVIRGGFGSSTVPFPDNTYAFNLPVKQRNQFTSANSFVPVTQGTMGQGIPAPVVVSIPDTGILDASNLRTQNFDVVPLDLKEGRLHSWNVAFQRELPWNFTGEIAYVGNHGQDILSRFNLNATLVPGLDQAGRPLNQQYGRTADTITWIPTTTSYHSMQVKVDRRFRNGFLITNSYTLGRGYNFSNGDSNGDISTPADIDLSYGLLENDRRHVFTSSFVYDIPFAREGILGKVAGGWQFAGLYTIQTGRPIDILASGSTLRAPGNTQRPNMTGKSEVYGDVSLAAGTKYFDTSVFTLPAPNTFGTLSRNGAGLFGPAYNNLDASVVKRFGIGGNVRAEIRIDVFNVFNRAQFDNPATAQRTLGDARFGEITSTIANTERLARFGFRVQF